MKRKLAILRIFLLRILPGKTFMKIAGGPLKGFKWKLSVKDNTYLLGNYEEDTVRTLENFLAPGMTVLDVGANTGYFTLLFARKAGPAGKVIAFEPLPANYSILCEHIRENEQTNIAAYELCIAAQSGVVEFSANANQVANTFIRESPVFRTSPTISVRSASLDELLSSGKITAPGLIKIDVEGAELEVLKGAQRLLAEFRPVLFIATHNNHQAGVKEKCVGFLNALGYELRSVSRNSAGDMEDFIALPGTKK